MHTLKDVKSKLECISLARSVDQIDRTTLRICTPLKYPDGSFIDVFIESGSDLDLQFKVSDASQTFMWLLDLAIEVPKAGRRKGFFNSILRNYRITEKDGELKTYVNETDELPGAVLTIAQAALRVSDLMFTQHLSKTTDFNNDFEDFLEAHELSFNEKRFEVYDKTVIIPYYIKGEKASSLVQTLSTKSVTSAPQISRDAFVRWYDISSELPNTLRVTVFDDQSNIIRESDIERLRNVSKIIPWSDQSTLIETLIG